MDKENTIARRIVANLLKRERIAKRIYLTELRAASEQDYSGFRTALALANYSEAHNAAEVSRRILNGVRP